MSESICVLKFDPNIFVSKYRKERIPEYICIKKLTQMNIRIYSYPKIDTNEYPNKYLDRKYSNIRIYSSHSGPYTLSYLGQAGSPSGRCTCGSPFVLIQVPCSHSPGIVLHSSMSLPSGPSPGSWQSGKIVIYAQDSRILRS